MHKTTQAQKPDKTSKKKAQTKITARVSAKVMPGVLSKSPFVTAKRSINSLIDRRKSTQTILFSRGPTSFELEVPTLDFEHIVQNATAIHEKTNNPRQMKPALSTQEVADLLNVSRPHVVKLLESGQIPFHKVGTHRRIYESDVLQYRKKQEAQSKRLLRELAQEAQELEFGYEP